MFQRVLVPTDFSETARKTLRCLTRIPGIQDIVLQHVVDATIHTKRGWTHQPDIENAKFQLEEEKERIEGPGLSVRIAIDTITSGDIAAAILARARKENVSCIVMGSRGRGLIQGLLLGSVSACVLRRGTVHLMIIRHSLVERFDSAAMTKFCSGIFSRVLCPTDFSRPAHHALSLIRTIHGVGEVHILHVVAQGETQEEITSRIAAAQKKLETIRGKCADAAVTVKTHIRLGRPTDEINTFANTEDVSLIFMSSRGRGLLPGILIGSTALGVAIHTNRPLVVVRAPPVAQGP